MKSRDDCEPVGDRAVCPASLASIALADRLFTTALPGMVADLLSISCVPGVVWPLGVYHVNKRA